MLYAGKHAKSRRIFRENTAGGGGLGLTDFDTVSAPPLRAVLSHSETMRPPMAHCTIAKPMLLTNDRLRPKTTEMGPAISGGRMSIIVHFM
jgi:hypothetical protein